MEENTEVYEADEILETNDPVTEVPASSAANTGKGVLGFGIGVLVGVGVTKAANFIIDHTNPERKRARLLKKQEKLATKIAALSIPEMPAIAEVKE